MRTAWRITEFTVAALIVIMLGALGGWYLFVRQEISDTESVGQSRGFGLGGLFDGSSSTTVNSAMNDDIISAAATTTEPAPRLWQVTRQPVAGFGFSTTSALYFADRANGNVYKADPDTSAVVRLSNTLVQKTYEAYFRDDGRAVLRTVGDGGTIQSLAARIIATSTSESDASGVLQGTYLPPLIGALSSYDDTLVYFVEDPDGGGVLVSSAWDGTGTRRLIELPLSEWRVHAVANGAVIAQNPGTGSVQYAYRISSGGVMTALVSGIGLTVLPHPSSQALIYGTGGGALTLYSRTSASAAPERLSIRTTADKCVWASTTIAYCAVPTTAPSADYIELRAQGLAHTSDTWWRVDVAEGEVEQFFSPSGGLALDVENPRMSDSGSTIGFMNARDKSLWTLRIVE